jgi:hypothetical protein
MNLPGSGNSVAGEPGDESEYMRRLEYARNNTRIGCSFCLESKPEYQVQSITLCGNKICDDCRQGMTIGKLVKFAKSSSSGNAIEDAEYLTDLINEVWPQHRMPTVTEIVKKSVKTKNNKEK